MQRAYRDFSRTIINIPAGANERKEWRYKLYDILMKETDFILKTSLQSQEAFDTWHKSTCCLLVESSDFILTFGQAQKWVNMNLKYLFSFGNTRIPGIALNYKYFHIPIDNIIQNAFLIDHGIKKIPCAWSKINEYAAYMKYQQDVREALKGRIAMDEEFRLFNKYLK
jgi:hypothetical protein